MTISGLYSNCMQHFVTLDQAQNSEQRPRALLKAVGCFSLWFLTMWVVSRTLIPHLIIFYKAHIKLFYFIFNCPA